MAYFSRPQSSSAVRIAQPTDSDDKTKSPQKKDSSQRQCRNILIYGSCRFQDKGCIYYHPPPSSTSTDVAPEAPAPPSLSAQAVNAPVFVPRTSLDVVPTAPSAQSLPFTPSDSLTPYYTSQEVDYEDPSLSTYFGTAQSTFLRQPLDYHLYSHPIPDTFAPAHFISDNLREELQKRSEAVHTIPSIPYHVPEELQGYHSLIPLEPITPERRKLVSWYSTVYRATSINDGAAYVLRRIENFRLTHHAAFGMIESWSRIRHPNIVRIREAFTTRAFNDSSLVVCYDYHPNSQSLMELYFRSLSPSALHGQLSAASMNRIPEATLWTYIIQIANAIRVAHEAGLAIRMIDPAKILLTGKNRLRINACGIVDVLLYDTRQDTGLAQQEDLVMFGRLVIALCCSSITALNALPKALEVMGRMYSAEIKTLALYLISKPGPHKTIAQIMELIGTNRLVREMDEMQTANDRLEAELMSELENGRLVRLLCKFGFINERPEFAREPRWSETGDRYIIKLFRDYVFHKVDENGSPVVDLSHVLTCLNKLDCGSDERVMLVSRDEQSCLVVSFKEVKACIESAFSDLSRASR